MSTIRALFKKQGWVFVLLGLATLLTVYPVLPAPQARIMGWRGDNVQYVYLTGHVAQALFRGQPLLTDLTLNHPDTLSLTSTDLPYLSMMVVAPVAALFSTVLAYNLIIVVSAFLSGLFAYAWLYRLTASRVAGLAAGLLFVLTPYRVVHSYGHLQLISMQFVPAFFWALDGIVAGPARPQLKSVALLAGATALLAASSQYYLLMCALMGAVYFLLRLPFIRAIHATRALLLAGLACALSLILGGVVGSLPYLLTVREGVYRSYDIESTRMWSASLADFFAPAVRHWLWAEPMLQLYPRASSPEFTLYLGLAALALALIGLLARHRTLALPVGLVRAWVGVGGIALLLALGTDLHLAYGEPVNAAQPLYLPMYWLGQLPVLNLMRVWARFGVITILFVGLLAGLGLAHLQAAWAGQRWQRPALAACLALLVFDFAPGRLQQFSVTPRKVDEWLAQQPGKFAVAFLPVGDENYEAMLGSLLHHKQVVAFNHPQHIPRAFQQFASAAKDFPRPSSRQALCQRNLRYLVLNPKAFDQAGQPGWKVIEAQLQPAGWRVVHATSEFVVVDPCSDQ